jgi:hypothetical protein
MLKLAGFAVVLGAAYAAYHYLFGHGWLGTSACLFIWIILASLYKPGTSRCGTRIPLSRPNEAFTEQERQTLFGKDYKEKFRAQNKEK